MAISSIGYNLNNSYGAYIQRLTEATKKRLIELNIPFDDKTNEAEARILIKNAESRKEAELNAKNKNSAGYNYSNKDDILERAKNLAKQLGIQFDERTTADKLISLIENVLEEKIKSNQSNMQALSQLKEFSRELSSIQAQLGGSMGYDDKNQALLRSLEMLSQYNKNSIMGN